MSAYIIVLSRSLSLSSSSSANLSSQLSALSSAAQLQIVNLKYTNSFHQKKWNCSPDLAALVDTLQNQLEERGRQCFSFSLNFETSIAVFLQVPQKGDTSHL